MIVHLSGEILHREPGRVFLKAGAVGYAVYLNWKTEARMGQIGQPLELFTHQIVRENEMALYGFHSLLQLEVFEMLMLASKVGPKVALSFLNILEPAEVLEAILQGDPKAFGKIPGAGPKTLSQIILDCSRAATRIAEKHTIKVQAEVRQTATVAVSEDIQPEPALQEGLKRLGFTPSEIRVCLRDLSKNRGFEQAGTEGQLSLALKWFYQKNS